MFLSVAYSLANIVENPSEEKIMPNVFDDGLAEKIAIDLKN